MEVLRALPSAELAAVANFEVARAGVGAVAWGAPVDLRGVNLDEALEIGHRMVSLAGPHEANLAGPRTVTLRGVRSTKKGPGAAAAFERKVAATTAAMGAALVQYENGLWVFALP
jgi:hypothetical protein